MSIQIRFSFGKRISAPVKASLAFTICSIIQKGIALLSTPIFTRIMTTEQYGKYSIYQSWYSILTIIGTLNLFAGVYNNGLTKWPERKNEYTSSLQGLSTVSTGILLCVYLLRIEFWNKIFSLPTIMVIAIFAQLFVVPAFNYWSTAQRYEYKYKKLVIISVLMAMLSPLLGWVMVMHTQYKAEALALSYSFVQVCIGIFFYILNIKEGKMFVNKAYWKFALAFNIPLIPHYLSQTVLNQADRIMINNMIGSREAAIYSVAHNFALMFTIITNAINSSFIPYTYQTMKNKDYDKLRKIANSLVVLVAGACIVAMLIGPEFVRIFAAPEYYEARWVMIPIAESLLFMFIYPLFCNIEFYYERTKFIMIASTTAAVANVLLNYIMIRVWGYVAAAYATVICYAFLSIAHYCAYRAILNRQKIEKNIYDVTVIVGVSIGSVIIMGLLTLVYDWIVVRYLLLIVMLLVCWVRRKQIIGILTQIRK